MDSHALLPCAMANEIRTLFCALLVATSIALLSATAGGANLTFGGSSAQTCVPAVAALPCTAPLPLPEKAGEIPAGVHLLVRLAPGLGKAGLQPLLASLGASVERELPEIRILSLQVPAGNEAQALRALQLHPGVEEVQQEAPVSAVDEGPNDAHWPGQWGLRRAAFPAAWKTTRGSAETVVAVVDTGVEASHPDLREGVLPGWDFVDRDHVPADEHGHGTAVAGVLAARTNNRAGIAGVCWSCRVLPVRVLDRGGRGDSATLAAGIIWAVDHGADVINLSLAGDRSTMAEEEALAYAARHDVVVVAAAGNVGNRLKQYPAADEHVISVAATDPSDRLYSWSSRGDWVDVSAPGCNTSPWRGGTYATFCGTSSAAPLVAGLAALIRSARPRATAAQVAQRVERAASPATGRVDAARIFPEAEHPRPPSAPLDRRSRLRHTLGQIIRRAAASQ